VAYEGMDTGHKIMGHHYKSPRCAFMAWIDEPRSSEVTLMSMWRLAEENEIKVTKEEF
jgi:hypothetical protein